MQTNYRELKIWKMAFDNTVAMYEVIAKLQQCESRNIADQAQDLHCSASEYCRRRKLPDRQAVP